MGTVTSGDPPGVPRAHGGHRWVPTTFLSINSRPVFRPVPVWAERLAEQLAVLGAEATDPGGLSECFNQSALLQTIVGDNEAARSICWGQIDWAVRLSDRRGDRGLLAYALQPWVNLGRLDVRQRQLAQALDHFSLAVSYAQRRALRLGPCTITGSDWDAIAHLGDDDWSRSSAGSLPRFLWTVFVVDSYRAYTAMRDPRGAERLLRSQRQSAPIEIANLIDEADVLRLLAQGCFDQAAAICSQVESATAQETFAYLEYQMACDIGRQALDSASALGLTLGVLCRSAAFAEISAVGRITLLTQLGHMLEVIGQEASAATAYSLALEVADSCCDERSIVMLTALLAQSRGTDGAGRLGRHAAPASSFRDAPAGSGATALHPHAPEARRLCSLVLAVLRAP